MTERRLRVVSYNVGGLRDGAAPVAAVLRPLDPDVVVVQDGPWRLRWRTPTASLASALGLVHAGGGRDSAGNVLLVKIRIEVDAVQCVQFPLVSGQALRAAVVGRCRLGGARFVVAGARLSDDPQERAGQRAALAHALAGVDDPVVVCGDLGPDPAVDNLVDASAGRADPAPAGPRGVILTGRGVRVEKFSFGEPGPTGYRPAVLDLALAERPTLPAQVGSQ